MPTKGISFVCILMKLKTSKSALKRFKISSRGKISRRRVGINHFNAKEGGNVARHKRVQKPLAKSNFREIKNLLPYDLMTM